MGKPQTPQEPTRYFEPLLLAFVRGHSGDPTLATTEAALETARSLDLHVDKFKRKRTLERVLKVIELVRPFAPATILEVGCGRGTAMWPMMEAFPDTKFTGVDNYPGRGRDLQIMQSQGIAQIDEGLCLSAAKLSGLSDRTYDVTLCLEVLEHLETEKEVESAAKELLRVSKKAVVVSVPSVPDHNPDHKRLFTEGILKNLFLRAGGKSVTITSVPKHFVALILRK
jgi:ubiquinone/menaquinone biosynthesis C-methylase UbiE